MRQFGKDSSLGGGGSYGRRGSDVDQKRIGEMVSKYHEIVLLVDDGPGRRNLAC